MTKLQAFYDRTGRLEEFVILAYAVVVFLPITYTWIVLIAGIVVFAVRAVLEALLCKDSSVNSSDYQSAGGCSRAAPTTAEAAETAGTGTAVAGTTEAAETAGTGTAVAGTTEIAGTGAAAAPVGAAREQPPPIRLSDLFNGAAFQSIREAPFTIPLLVFAAVVFVTGCCNGGVKEGLASLVGLRSFLIYFIAYHAFRASSALLQKTLLVLLSVGAIAGIWGSIQQVFHYHPFDYPYLQASGFMGRPMAYAGQMETTACLALGLLLTGGWEFVIKNRVAFILIALCNMAGLFFASERSAWLGALFAILAMSYLISLRVFAKVMIGLALVGVLSWFFVPVVQTRVLPLLNNIKSDVGVQARFVIWQRSLDIYKEHPVVGVGFRKFPKIDIPEAIVPGESEYLVHAHNNFLHIMATMGTLGLLSFAYLEFSTLIVALRAWVSKTNDRFSRAMGLSILGGVVSLMVAGLFEYNFGTGHVTLMHWFVLAMLMRNASGRNSSVSETSTS